MTTILDPMWDALARYQSYADADKHGDSWRKMCEERTQSAADAASWYAENVWTVGATVRMAMEAALAAARAEISQHASEWSGLAIKRIEQAIKERA